MRVKEGNFDTDPAGEAVVCYEGKDNEGQKHAFAGSIRFMLYWKTAQYGSDWQLIDNWVVRVSPDQFDSAECGENSYAEILQPPNRWDEDRSGSWRIWANALFSATGEQYEAERTF